MRRPAFFLACMVLMGAVVGRLALPSTGFVLALGAILLVLTLALAPRAMRPDGLRYRAPVTRMLLALVFLIAFFQQNQIVRREKMADERVAQFSALTEVTLRGTVSGEPSLRGERQDRVIITLRDVEVLTTATLRDVALPLGCQVQLSLVGKAARQGLADLPMPGEGLEVVGRIRQPPQAIHSDLFDYRAFLKTRGIGATVTLFRSSGLRRIAEQDNRPWTVLSRWISPWRRTTLERLSSAFSSQRAGVLRCMMLGDTGGLDGELRETFVRIGGAHLFAVSGLHTGLIAGMVFLLCRLFLASPKTSSWIMIGCLFVYLLLVGFRPPVVRAFIMAVCLVIPFVARRAVDSLNALSLAIFITIIVNPLAPFRSDFQLSYLCAFSLIVLRPSINEILTLNVADRFSKAKRLSLLYNRWIAMPLGIVVAIQVATLPLLSIYFHQISLVGFVSNIVMVPLAALVLAAGWAFALIGPLVPLGGAFFGGLASLLTGFFIKLAELFAVIPGGAMQLMAFPWWLLGLYYLLVFTGPHMRMWRSPGASQLRRARMLPRLAAIVALLVWWPLLAQTPLASGIPKGSFQLTMLDIGQGDSFLLRLPNDRTVLIDTGRRGSGRNILEYLKTQGIEELDALLLTHSDADHIGSAPAILDGVHVDRVLLGPSRSNTAPQRRLDDALIRNYTTVREVDRGDRLRVAPTVRLEILNPPPPSEGAAPRTDINEQSLVLLAEFGQMTFLFTGDAGTFSEREMLAYYGPAYLQSEILKVGHHGSRSSTGETFLSAVLPEIALISVGKENPYGHPHAEVIEALERHGTRIYNTAEQGSVELRTDGHRLWIRTTRENQRGTSIGAHLDEALRQER